MVENTAFCGSHTTAQHCLLSYSRLLYHFEPAVVARCAGRGRHDTSIGMQESARQGGQLGMPCSQDSAICSQINGTSIASR